MREKKEYLKGIVEQNGYVIMSLKDQSFEEDKANREHNVREVQSDRITINKETTNERR
jgi:hypothetical protein